MSVFDALIMQLSFNSSSSQEKTENINFIVEQIFISNLSFNNFDLCWNFLRKIRISLKNDIVYNKRVHRSNIIEKHIWEFLKLEHITGIENYLKSKSRLGIIFKVHIVPPNSIVYNLLISTLIFS